MLAHVSVLVGACTGQERDQAAGREKEIGAVGALKDCLLSRIR